MDTRTISDNLRELLGPSPRVLAAVFTTFNFETEFFEQEVVPLLLDAQRAFSSDQQIKPLQIRQALNEVQLPIEVFYDLYIFRQHPDKSPAMEYLHHGVDCAPYAFHPKLCLILFEDAESDTWALLVGCGSANLTKAGWWDNIECQHWEKVADGAVAPAFTDRLLEDLEWLSGSRQATPNAGVSAVDCITEFLTNRSVSNSAPPVQYYGLRGVDRWRQRPGDASFIHFIRTAAAACRSGHDTGWRLDIVSPYFASDATSQAHRQLADALGVEQIRLFLPTNDRREALCTEAYYDAIAETPDVTWCDWHDCLRESLDIASGHYRRTHAKLYHLYNDEQSWIFTGSVNFTHEAFYNNIEAGFFTSFGHCQSLLQARSQRPARFCDAEELQRKRSDAINDPGLPKIRLLFDWQTDTLSGQVHDKNDEVIVCLLNAENTALVRQWRLCSELSQAACDPDKIRKLLTESGLVKIAGRRVHGGFSFPEHRVLVQEINWTHKPLELPNLSPQQIIQIYASLRFERRNQLVADLAEERLLSLGVAGEQILPSAHEDAGRQFFCEYAELFQAFRNIRRRMRE